MKVKLAPPDSRVPTFFGMHYNGFFKIFVFVNMIQSAICISLVSWEIYIVAEALKMIPVVEPLIEVIKLYGRAVLWVWFTIQSIITLATDVWLFRTAASPNIFFLQVYTFFHAISPTLFASGYYTLIVVGLIQGSNLLPYPPTLANVLLPGYVLYRLYTSYIVYRYSKDIDFEVAMQSAYRNLTQSEILQFEMGLSEGQGEAEKMRVKAKVYETCHEMATFEKYNRKEFEIPLENLDFSESTTLGCGEYGCVYKVNLLSKCRNKKTEVAVKTVDPTLSDVNHFKALLTEAKVMTFMGKHENIVELIGICTSEIHLRKLFIVCELCKFGNLLSYLRSERNTFVNEYCDYPDYNANTTESLSTQDLIKWSYQIASGMEFLSSKRIIHGDLATRNVLLTADKTAKITDFGLSRKLYSYSVYTKRGNVPLPWRWLALESLIDLDFSTMSDVWMFGITLWEIFELGGRPWPNIQLFCTEFIEKLKDGYRPERPKYSSNDIYSAMSSCWEAEPSARQTFSKLQMYFEELYNKRLNTCEVKK